MLGTQLIRVFVRAAARTIARVAACGFAVLRRRRASRPPTGVVSRSSGHACIDAPSPLLLERFPLEHYERVIRRGAARDARLLHLCRVDDSATCALFGVEGGPAPAVLVEYAGGD